jgi:hypothetical protein
VILLLEWFADTGGTGDVASGDTEETISPSTVLRLMLKVTSNGSVPSPSFAHFILAIEDPDSYPPTHKKKQIPGGPPKKVTHPSPTLPSVNHARYPLDPWVCLG